MAATIPEETRQRGNLVALPIWGTPTEAASAYGISARTLRLRAKQGKVDRRGKGKQTQYRLPDGTPRGNDAGMPLAAMPPLPATIAAMPQGDAATLRALLAAEQTARIDAERRAAVAEYRVAIAEVDPAEVEALRATVDELEANVATLTTERDQARDQAQALAGAMRKRHGLIKRLTARLANA